MSGYPTDSSHLSILKQEEMVALFTGNVESRFAALSIANQFWPAKRLVNTNSMFNRYMGDTQLQKIVPGVRPPANPTGNSKRGVVVDTLINARNNVDKLNNVQADFNLVAEIGLDQGKTHAQFYDEVHLHQVIKGAQAPIQPGINGAIPAGQVQTLPTVGAEDDPDALVLYTRKILDAMRELHVPANELIIFVRPTQFSTLIDNEMLTKWQWSEGNADWAKRILYRLNGVAVFETTAIPRTPTPTGEHHPMSNDLNANMYDVSELEAKAQVVIAHRKSLMPAASIFLETDIWYNKEEKQTFIDSDIAFGVTYNRTDVCGVVFAA